MSEEKETAFQDLVQMLKLCFRKDHVLSLPGMKLGSKGQFQVVLIRAGNTATCPLTEVRIHQGEVPQGAGMPPSAIILGDQEDTYLVWLPREKNYTDYLLLELREIGRISF